MPRAFRWNAGWLLRPPPSAALMSSVALIDEWVRLQPRCVWLCPELAEGPEDEDPPEPEHGAPVRINVTVSALACRVLWPDSAE